MLGVISAVSPEKAAAKVFRQKFKEEKELFCIIEENPFEIRIRDLGAGSDSNFKLWIKVFEGEVNGDSVKNNKKENKDNNVVKKLVVRKMS